MARLRAIENRRYLLRATNDGITAVIDPYGRVEKQVARYQSAVLPANFCYLGGRTFYTEHGDVFAWLCIGLAWSDCSCVAFQEQKVIEELQRTYDDLKRRTHELRSFL